MKTIEEIQKRISDTEVVIGHIRLEINNDNLSDREKWSRQNDINTLNIQKQTLEWVLNKGGKQ